MRRARKVLEGPVARGRAFREVDQTALGQGRVDALAVVHDHDADGLVVHGHADINPCGARILGRVGQSLAYDGQHLGHQCRSESLQRTTNLQTQGESPAAG